MDRRKDARRLPRISHTVSYAMTRVSKKGQYPGKDPTIIKFESDMVEAKEPAKFLTSQITRKNADESPLLRLPPELRNRIWKFALSGCYINVQLGGASQYRHKRKTRFDVMPLDIHGNYIRAARLEGTVMPNFQLSRVCQQIYHETALLPYQLNTFSFCDHRTKAALGSCDRWIRSRNPAQKNAVASLRPPNVYFDQYQQNYREKFGKIFPGLQRLDITHVSWAEKGTSGYLLDMEAFLEILKKRNDTGFVIDWDGKDEEQSQLLQAR